MGCMIQIHILKETCTHKRTEEETDTIFYTFLQIENYPGILYEQKKRPLGDSIFCHLPIKILISCVRIGYLIIRFLCYIRYVYYCFEIFPIPSN